jgi:hypothetical protein
MRDYKCYLPHHREFELMNDKTTNILAALILVLMVWLLCWMFIDAIVKTVESEEEQRIYRADTVRPKAFRMASPTADQMDATEALLQIQPLVRR